MKKPYTEFKKRYRKKLMTRFVIAVGFCVIASLVVISYLGSLAGNYTVQLSRDNRQLTMADNLAFDNATTRLRAEGIEGGTQPITYRDLPNDEILDADNSASHNANNVGISGGAYVAYTFYVRNLGETPFNYYLEYNIDKIVGSGKNALTRLDNILRVIIYQNSLTYNEDGTVSSNHQKSIYAKKIDVSSDKYDRYGILDDGQIDDRECVAYNIVDGDKYIQGEYIRATEFIEDQNNIIIKNNVKIAPYETIRYTSVMWFEGTDPECQGEYPQGASLLLSMKITGVD